MMTEFRGDTQMSTDKALTATLRIENIILAVRDQRVIVDSDLATIYGVTTKALNQAVKRNAERFPPDFVFRLTLQEVTDLRSGFVTSSSEANRSQFVTGSQRHRDPRHLPHAFTEHGALMAANVLRSPRAVEMSLFVVRAFVRLRRLLASNAELTRRLDDVEKKYDAQFRVVFDAIRQLMAPPEKSRRSIGFKVEETRPAYRVKRPARRARA
jgi:hypothetical protein